MALIPIKLQSLHSAQQEIAAGLSTRTVLRCGRRLGKTTFLEEKATTTSMIGLAVGWFTPNYKLLVPTYKRVLRTLRPAVQSSSRQDNIIHLRTGGLVEFWTMGDEDAGRSRSYDLVIIDEASLQIRLREIWEKSISPTLLDRGGDAIMAGTPKGIDPENYFYAACTEEKDKYDPIERPNGWKELHFPTHANPHLDQKSKDDLIKDYPPLVYQQEFLAEFVDWSGEAFFSLPSLLIEGVGAPVPKYCQVVFAVIDTAVKTGQKNDGTSCTYFSYDPHAVGHKLTILDWDVTQIEGSMLEVWLPTVFQRLAELAVEAGAVLGSIGAYIEDKVSGTILIQQARRRGWPAMAIDSKLTAVGKDERAISVSGYVFRGEVKITEYARTKMVRYKGVEKNHFLSQVLGFRVGVGDQVDDALDTFTYGIAITLGDSKGY